MKTLRTALRLGKADFLERSRRFAFLVTLAVSLYAGYAFLPPNHSTYVTLRFAEHRGIYNSAWIGAAIALLTAAFVGLIGFYVIKNAIDRDRHTRVGEILAAAPISRFVYVLSKALSNFGVLATVALALVLSAMVTQLVRAEDTHLRLTQFLLPYLLLTLPSMSFIAALAALFECTPGLRGGGGNVAYFLLWGIGLSAASQLMGTSGGDFQGFGLLVPSIQQACGAAFDDCGAGTRTMAMGLNFKDDGVWDLSTFVWNGMGWTTRIVAIRLLWLVAALAVVALAAMIFDRFRSQTAGAGAGWLRGIRRAAAAPGAEEAPALPGLAEHYRVAPLEAVTLRAASASRFLTLVHAEIRLLLKGASRWWYLVMLGLWVASAVTPLERAREHVLPLVWIWPVLLWSGMGLREARYGTDQILYATPHPLRLQMPAAWLGGVAVAVVTGAVIAARLLAAGDWAALGAWTVGACFIPALALALGVWSGTSRFFEGLYTALWYMGPLQPIAGIDFMGASRAAIQSGTPVVFAIATVGLVAAAFLGRRRQLRR
jgi:hypothetical protein